MSRMRCGECSNGGISQEQVERTVAHPDAKRPARRIGAKRIEKGISARRRLAIIVEEESRLTAVISAFWM